MSLSENSEITSSKAKIVLEIDAFPFKGLKISEDWSKLESVEGRTICSKCNKSRKYFCYTCYVPVPEVQHIVPNIKLPVKIDIIKHAREMDGKSTAVHAAVLAPQDVQIFTYPCIPDYDPADNVILIFPNKDAVSVEEVCESFFRKVREPVSKRPCLEGTHCVVHRAVFIDSTWNQSRGIFKDPRIKALPSVVLKSRLSQFWRHQADSPRWYLATVEAIHQFLVELDAAQWRLERRTSCSWSKAEGSTENVPRSETEVDCTRVIPSHTVDSEVRTVKHPSTLQDSKDNNTNINEANVDDALQNEKRSHSDKVEYSYDGKYDNLLFFFRFMYSKIHTLYDHDNLRSYKRRLE